MPERFGNYVVHERLGSGGMATVDRATISGIGGFERAVALKRLLPNLAYDEAFIAAFVREARIAAQLRHLNVAQTYDLGRVGESYYIAMELIEGDDLRKVLKQSAIASGPMPPALVLNLVGQVCDALAYAHALCDDRGEALGIVHRDVSPANVIVSKDGTAKLIDFGIARASATSLMTMSGQLKGKFAYIAPETMRGEFDARADLFSLGVVAWELLTARPLFSGQDEIDTLNRVRELEVPPPSKLAPGITEDIDTIVLTALVRDPAERWQSAAAMRGALTVVSSRPGLRATNADLARWIDWCFTVRPTGRRAAVSVGRFTGGMSVPRERHETYELPPPPEAADSMDVTLDEDSVSVDIKISIDSGVHPTLDSRAPERIAFGSSELERAERLGAAPASSETLEALVGQRDLTPERPSTAMRLVRRSADQAVTAPVGEIDFATTQEARAVDPQAASSSDLETSITGEFRVGVEPITLVDVPEVQILAEMPAPAPGAMRTIPGGASAPPRAPRDSPRVINFGINPPSQPGRPGALGSLPPQAPTMVAAGTPHGTPHSTKQTGPTVVPYAALGPDYEAAAAAYREELETQEAPRAGARAARVDPPDMDPRHAGRPPRRGVGILLAVAICATIGGAAVAAIYLT